MRERERARAENHNECIYSQTKNCSDIVQFIHYSSENGNQL